MSTPSKNLIVYGIPNCDTVKKARVWLAEHGLDYQFHDFKKLGVPPEHLKAWVDAVGWEKVLNRKGTTWRKLDPATQAAVVDAASATQLLLQEPSVIKRPVVEWAEHRATERISVGFVATEWSARLK